MGIGPVQGEIVALGVGQPVLARDRRFIALLGGKAALGVVHGGNFSMNPGSPPRGQAAPWQLILYAIRRARNEV